MFVTRKFLSRRAMLRGISAAVSLPLLDAMVPAFATAAQSVAARQLRFGAVYVPHGALPDEWHPKEVGRDFTFTHSMKPLEPFREQLLTVSGLLATGKPLPHAGASGGWLNGVGARSRQNEPLLSYKTIDQHIADKLGEGAPLLSIEAGTEDMGTLLGACSGYSCLYFNALSWRTDTVPRPVTISPRMTFERMFGETGTVPQRLAKLRYKQSILDMVSEQAKQLSSRVGAADKVTLDNYLQNIREVEGRLQKMSGRTDLEAPPVPAGVPQSFEEHLALTYDLMHLALQGDITRVFTFLTNMEGTNRGYAFLGIPESFHVTSHHGDQPELKERYMRIVNWHVEQFAKFVHKLRNTQDGDGTLLDHSVILYGSGMSNANAHDPYSPPTVVIGGANGKLVGNRHIACTNREPAANFLLTLGDLCGVHLEKIGTSTGRIAI